MIFIDWLRGLWYFHRTLYFAYLNACNMITQGVNLIHYFILGAKKNNSCSFPFLWSGDIVLVECCMFIFDIAQSIIKI